MARHAGAAVILVADIDRGGVFASCYGSIKLQSPEDQHLIRGIIVNKFRGDLRLFDEGRHMLEQYCGVPVLGVVPYCKDLHIDAEDSVVLERRDKEHGARGKQHGAETSQSSPLTSQIKIAVVLLRHLSNFTDFDMLERDPRVHLFYTDKPDDLEQADIIILPGTKATLDDLYHLRLSGLAAAILKAHAKGTVIMGICGGFQMLGQQVDDPDGIEGDTLSMPGLGLLPIHTVMTQQKTTRQVEFDFQGQRCRGYEIHQGVSTAADPFVIHNHCIGTYIHGCLDNAAVVDFLLNDNRQHTPTMSIEDYREQQYDYLADHVRRHIDMDRLYQILKT